MAHRSNCVEEALKIVEMFHAKFGSDKRLHINEDGEHEIVPATPDEMRNAETELSKYSQEPEK